MKNLLLILLLIPFSGFAQRDTLGVLVRSSLSDAQSQLPTKTFYASSPAAMLHLAQRPLTQLALRMDLRREEQARLQPLGDGGLDGGFYAESFQRIDSRSVVWADARYVRGRRTNLCWNSTADYLLLYPYITADSVGGDLTREEYAFGGGYARRLGRIDLALRGDYRAAQEYRQIDPRPHNVVSDFTLKVSLGMELAHYALGLDLQGRLYKQHQKINSYDRVRVRTLFMTGLGSYFERYSGKNENIQVAFDGREYEAAVWLIPRQELGWYGRASYGKRIIDRDYVPNNSIPVSTLETHHSAADVAYRSGRWSLRVGAEYELRRGIELVADRNGQGAIVDRQTMYQNRTWALDAEASVVWHHGSMRYTLRPRAQWWQSSACYLDPARRMELSRVGGMMRGDAEWLGGRWRLKATAGVGYYASPQGELVLDGLASHLSDYLRTTAERIGDRAVMLEAALRTERRLPRGLAGFVEAEWRPDFYAGGAVEHRLSVACGILF